LLNHASQSPIPGDLPAAGSTPIGIAVGVDGNLWFAEKTGNRIGQAACFSPSTMAA